MRLNLLLQNLALGELSGSPAIDLNTYEIESRFIPKVINAFNQASMYVYSTLPLKIDRCKVQIKPGIRHYKLYKEYAYYAGTDYPQEKYILDSQDKPFNSEVIRVIEVRLEGQVMPLNSELEPSVVVNNGVELHLPTVDGLEGLVLDVIYQAAPPLIPVTENKFSHFDVEIPPAILQTVQAYCACLVYQNMGGNHLVESNALFAKFKTLYEDLKISSVNYSHSSDINIKPMLGGWV